MIVVIDYGMGNLRSISKALKKINADFIISNKVKDIKSATHLILPGVGFFEEGIKNLREFGLIDILKEEVLVNKKPFLGICLGMQLLFKTSEEGGLIQGLGFIDGEVVRFKFNNNELKIPHIGWNRIFGKDLFEIPIFQGIDPDSNFYFVHSYHPVLHEKIKCVFTDYGYNFVSAIQKENIFATQFHPEKSQKKGLQIIKNFVLLKNAKN
jgi:glutamine amidotransferase